MKTRILPAARLSFPLACAIAALVAVSSAHAAVTWNAGTAVSTDGLWSTATNWTADTAPLDNDDLIFSGTTNQTNSNDVPLTSLNSLTLSNAGWNITLGTMTLNGGGLVANGNSTVAGTVTLGAPQTWSNSVGTLTFNGSLDAASFALAIDGVGSTTLAGGTISNAASLTKNGSGNLTLSGDNSYAGATLVNSGGASAAPVLTVSHINALGTTAGGTTLFGSNTTGNGTQLNLTGGITVTDETLTLDSTASGYRASLITSGTAIWDGNVELNGSGGLLAFNTNGATANLTVGSSADDTVTLTNNLVLRGTGTGTGGGTVKSTIQNSAGVTKTDAGIWTLTAANTYTGPTRISNGTLSINSIQSVSVGASSIGNPTTPADGTIGMGEGGNSGTLLYTGSDATTDRVINLIGTTGGATLNQSSLSGLLKFTSPFTATGNGGKTMTLTGSTGGTGEISGAIVNNGTVSTKTTSAAFIAAATTITLADVTGITTGSRITGTGLQTNTVITAINTTTNVVTISPQASGAGSSGQTMTITAITALTKAGTGTWTLSGNNTYTGVTSLGAGVLMVGSANAIPGGLGTTGGLGGLLFNGGTLGLGPGSADFTRSYGTLNGTSPIGGFYTPANFGASWAAYGADRIVNVGGAGAAQSFFNGKPLNFGTADSTHMVEFKNGLGLTTVTRLLVANRGTTPGGVDGLLSGVITESAGVLAGVDKTGNGTVAMTGASTFTGSVLIKNGTIIVNSLSNTGIASPIGQGLSGFTLLGGAFKYAPVTPAGGVATGGGGHSTNRNFGISASGSIDASGTGALIFNAPTGNIISPDVTGISFTATGANKILTLTPGNTTNLAVGMTVTGPGIAANSTIASIVTTTGTLVTNITLTSSANVTSTSGSATFGYPSARTLTLTGTNTGANTLAGILQDSSSISAGVLSLAKTGPGSWTLGGANTYTGGTTVTGGTLSVTNASGLGTGSVSVTEGANLTYSGAADVPLAIGGNLTITGGAGAAIGGTIGSTGSSAPINVAGDAIATGAVTVNVNMTAFSGVPGTYTLIKGAGGGSTLDGATYTVGNFVNNTGFTVANLTSTPTDLTITLAGTPLTTAFWKGGLAGSTNVWAVSSGTTASNWTETAGGAVQGLVPGSGAAVVFSATSPTTAPSATVLGANMTINSLTLSDDANAFALNPDGYTLTVGTGGITKNNATPQPATIAAPIALGGDQIWSNSDTTNPLTISGQVSGAFLLTTAGTGTLTLTAANPYSGGLTISSGTLQLGSGATTGSIPATTSITNNGNLTINRSNAFSQATDLGGMAINGGGSVTQAGTGTTTLSVANGYAGATTVNAGTLSITNNDALGTTASPTTTTINGGNGSTAVTLTLTNATTDLLIAENLNFAGNASGRAQLTNNSALNHTLSGLIDVSSATNHTQFLSTGAGSITITGDITGTMSDTAVLFLRGTSTSATNRVIGSVNLTGGDLFKTDTGTWLVGASGETYSWANLLVANGILKMGAANVLPNSPLILGNPTGGSTGTLDLNGFSQSVPSIFYNGAGVSTGTRTITNSDAVNAAVLTVVNATDNPSLGTNVTTNNVVFTGNLGLLKDGPGILTLTGVSTYTGGTIVSDGTLLVNNSSGSGTGTAAVAVNGTSTLGGSGTISGTVTVAATANLSPGAAAATAGVLKVGGDLDISAQAGGAGTLAYDLNTLAGTNDKITVTGTLNIGIGALGFNDFAFTNLGGLQVGTYKLITSGGLTGTLDPANLTGTIGALNAALQLNGNDVELVVGTAYDSWATLKGLTVANNGKGADPDGDGKNNLSEFAFDGNPLSGANDGKIVGKIATVGPDQVMTLTLPVRGTASTPAFAPDSNDQLSALVDGIYYRVEGDVALSPFADAITEVTGGDAATIQTGLPALTSGWTYRTFRAPGTVPTVPKAFLRAKISETP